MASLYPTDKEITIFGEKVKYPGLDPNGKFTNGSFTDPKQLASFIPAETLNLILDNLSEAIKSVGLEPNNIDTDQLAKALNIRTKNNIIQQEILEELVVFDINNNGDNAPTILTPDENQIIYSQDINLKKSLAKKIGRKEEDIEIINFNLIPVFNYKKNIGIINSFFGNSYPNANSSINFNDKFILCMSADNNSKENVLYEIGIQVADDFTEDIKNYTPNMFYRNMLQESSKYKATFLYLGVNYRSFANQYSCFSAAELFGVSYVSIIENIGNTTNSPSVDEFDSNYYYSYINKILYKSPTINIGSVANYDVPTKLLYGDNIKIRIKLFTGESINAYVYKVFDVAVRYKIINN